MICYKWVIKKNNQYFPIINNGAYCKKGSLNINLPAYTIGKTFKKFINFQKLLGIDKLSKLIFHREGFHFWKYIDKETYDQYQKCMKNIGNNEINCTLKCYIRNKDIIIQDNKRVIAKKFRTLEEMPKINFIKVNNLNNNNRGGFGSTGR